MPPSIQITLKRDIALPALEIWREGLAELAGTPDRLLNGSPLTPDKIAGGDFLLRLFSPDFHNTGLLVIREYEAPSFVRACSLLRLHLRQGRLSALSEEALQKEPSPDCDAEKYGILSYLLLATLQEIVLKNFGPVLSTPPRAEENVPLVLVKWLLSLGRRRAPVSALPTTPAVLRRVRVLDDPVNSMSYVVVVFQRLLGLPEETARQRMQEVHTLKCSTVWEGPEAEAQSRVQALQNWHLNAELEPLPAEST